MKFKVGDLVKNKENKWKYLILSFENEDGKKLKMSWMYFYGTKWHRYDFEIPEKEKMDFESRYEVLK